MSMSLEHQREASFAADLRSVFNVLRSHAWLIALCIGIGLALALLSILITPKTYEAKGVIQVEQESPKVVKIDEIRPEDLKSVEGLKTFEQNVTSPEVLLRVIHDPQLAGDPAFLPEAARRTDNALQEALARHVDAKLRRGTRLIDITVQHQSPVLAQRIANLLVQEFSAWNREARRDAGQAASHFLIDEAERLRERLSKSEQALQAYKEQNDAVSLEEKQNITVEKLKELNLRVTQANAERLKLESDCNQLRSVVEQHAAEQLLQIPGIASAPVVVDLKKAISEREAHLATLNERYKAEHPKLIEAESELAKLRAELEVAANKAADVLVASYQSAILNEQKLEGALHEQQKLALELNKIAIPYAALLRDMESDRALYDTVLTRLKETDITKAIVEEPIRIVSRALLPDHPVKPQRKVALALGLVGGLALGTILAFLLDVVKRGFASARDAEARLRLRALAEIPKVTRSAKTNSDPTRVLSDSIAAEAFRSLRATLSLPRHDHSPRSYLFTSALQGEGKTFCAVNCAISFAQAGLKTLLIDADLRQPQLAKLFSLTMVGAGNAQATRIAHLSVVSANDGNPDGAGLLAGTAFEELIRQAMSTYDRVIVDTAPVNLFSDTLLLARSVQSVCLVVQAEKTPAEEVIRAAERLTETEAAVIGFVWNQAKSAPHYYYTGLSPRDGSNVLRGWFGDRANNGYRVAQAVANGTPATREPTSPIPSSRQF